MIRLMCICKSVALRRDIAIGKGDPVNVKGLPSYANMLTNRGRYLALFGQHERAIAAFEQALALNPNLTLARQRLSETAKARARSSLHLSLDPAYVATSVD